MNKQAHKHTHTHTHTYAHTHIDREPYIARYKVSYKKKQNINVYRDT